MRSGAVPSAKLEIPSGGGNIVVIVMFVKNGQTCPSRADPVGG
jgi:hypothetical protein